MVPFAAVVKGFHAVKTPLYAPQLAQQKSKPSFIQTIHGWRPNFVFSVILEIVAEVSVFSAKVGRSCSPVMLLRRATRKRDVGKKLVHAVLGGVPVRRPSALQQRARRGKRYSRSLVLVEGCWLMLLSTSRLLLPQPFTV